MSLKKLRQRGDTIIEVLISIAIIGSIMAGAYVTANSSLRSVRDAQEHEEATSLATSEAEILGAQPISTVFPTYFCFNPSVTGSVAPIGTSLGGGSAQCTSMGTDKLYTVIISTVTTPGGNNLTTYQIRINWSRLGGGGDNNAYLYYQPLAGG